MFRILQLGKDQSGRASMNGLPGVKVAEMEAHLTFAKLHLNKPQHLWDNVFF